MHFFDGLIEAHYLFFVLVVVGVGSWEWDVVTGEVSWSAQMYALAGQPVGSPVSVGSFLELVLVSDRERVQSLLTAAVRDSARIDYECRIVLRPDGSVRDIHAIGEFLVADDGTTTKMFGTCQDITERKQLQDEIRHLALHDPLTGLANRALLLERLEHALAGEALNPSALAVLYLDLDVRVSIGIAIARPQARPEDALRDADAEMYAAKRQGKDAYSVFPALTP